MGNTCAIIVISHKEQINELEQISLLQLKKVLGEKWPIYLICPDKNNVSQFVRIIPEIIVKHIDDWWLSDYDRFGRYKLDPSLYRKFLKFKYILFYELDCFVFRDELQEWMNKGYDYVGAPWYEHFHKSHSESKLLDMGNGGFSLRRTSKLFILAIINKLVRGKKYDQIKIQEDMIWVRHILPYSFRPKLPSSIEALHFAFETNPEKAYSTIGKNLPFGVHAWFKNKRYFEFYRPFISREGYQLGEFKNN